MAKSLSIDLRERLVSVVDGGMTRRSAAKRFGVAASTAIKWMDQWRRTGNVAPRPRGGDRRSERIESFLGYELSELTKLTPSDLHPHEIPRLEVFIKTVLEKKRWTSDELSCRTKSGDTVPAQIRATSVHVFGSNCILAIIHNRRTDKLAELGQAIRKVVHDVRILGTTGQPCSLSEKSSAVPTEGEASTPWTNVGHVRLTGSW